MVIVYKEREENKLVCVDLTNDDLMLSLSYIDGGESFEFLVAEVGSEHFYLKTWTHEHQNPFCHNIELFNGAALSPWNHFV